jgi:CheY-like chemotaxis protein
MTKSILVVDDNRLIVSGLLWGLSCHSKDWQILSAENGEEAVRLLARVRVDFLLTDLQMPVMDGYDLLAHARERYPSLPAIAMTGRSITEIRDKLQAIGATEVIAKPFSISTLADRIEDLLT